MCLNTDAELCSPTASLCFFKVLGRKGAGLVRKPPAKAGGKQVFCRRPYLDYLCSNTPVLQKTRGHKGRVSGLAGSTSRLSHKNAKCVKLPAHQFSVSSMRGFNQTTVNYLKVPTNNNILELGKEFGVSSSVGAAFLTWRKLTLSRSQVRAET